MAAIKLQKTINKDAETIFRFLTDQDLLMLWYAPQVIAFPLEGTTAAFAFGSDVNFKMRISELIEFEKLKWVCVDGNVDWLDSIVTFTLKTVDSNKCRLTFRQSKLQNEEKLDQWKVSWNNYLEGLKEKCENFT